MNWNERDRWIDRQRERCFTYWWPREGGEKERSSMSWKKKSERERKIFSYRSGKIPLRAATTF